MHARYYNPLVARFLSTDKANDWSAASPQSWNRYAYTRNNPLKYVDPDGNAIQFAAGAAAAYAAIETGLSIWDGVETTKIVADPNVSWKSKGLAVGLFGLGLIGPGAGYGLADDAGRRVDDAASFVIGKMDDLRAPGALRDGERLLDLPDRGATRANWAQNSSRLREAMGHGKPIRDLSVDPRTGALRRNTGFVRGERNLLRSKGWTYDSKTRMWYPPK